MKKKTIIILVLFLAALFFVFSIYNKNSVLESTTENIQIISKEQDISSSEQWIVLSSDKKIYINDISIWALIQVEQNYTIVYDLERSGKYKLRSIVPEDYKGQF
ncbi:hypothetical protein MPH47_20115 [Psychrobacillus psychrodurans]|uniref:hypothetical protein n=1 Tax=Psychrobacillus psychrodurans TaxID=126157 RepID=UPI001F4EAD21|nr:hypothetical protein [Psychrobacillus psychrodurans]MCK1999502.1 hypothetical protein [Psychrobacillus psychrodurans]